MADEKKQGQTTQEEFDAIKDQMAAFGVTVTDETPTQAKPERPQMEPDEAEAEKPEEEKEEQKKKAEETKEEKVEKKPFWKRFFVPSLFLGGGVFLFFALWATLAISGVLHRQSVMREMGVKLSHIKNPGYEKVERAELEGLPEPVKKWLLFTGVVGKARTLSVMVTQAGDIRFAPDGRMTRMEAKKLFIADPPTLIFYAQTNRFPFINFHETRMYYENESLYRLAIPPIATLEKRKAEEDNASNLGLLLSQMVWFPDFALNKHVVWQKIDNRSARAILHYRQAEASGVFHFDERGRLVDVFFKRRYCNEEGHCETAPAIMHYNNYIMINKMQAPADTESSINLRAGNFVREKVNLVLDVERNIGLRPED